MIGRTLVPSVTSPKMDDRVVSISLCMTALHPQLHHRRTAAAFVLRGLGYGFDAPRTQALQDAMRHYVGLSVKNPTFELRGPDRADLVKAAAGPLRELATGEKPPAPDAALQRAEDAWRALDAKVPRDALIRWRQRAAGITSGG